MPDRPTKGLTNKELIRFRKRMAVRELAIAKDHSRTHTGTAVHRKLILPDDPPSSVWPDPAVMPTDADLINQMQLKKVELLMMAGKLEAEVERRIRQLSSMPQGVPTVPRGTPYGRRATDIVPSSVMPFGRRKTDPATLVATPPVEPDRRRLLADLLPDSQIAKPWKRPGKD